MLAFYELVHQVTYMMIDRELLKRRKMLQGAT